MTIPKYEEIMLPLLEFAKDNKEHQVREAYEYLSKKFKLTDEEIEELLPSGTQSLFENRVGWARTYLVKAGLLESKKRGYFNITKRGSAVLQENLKEINSEYLKRYPEFVDFNKSVRTPSGKDKRDSTPFEIIENNFQLIRNNLANELLQKVKESNPRFFENLVVDLLVKMGYGGTRKDAARVIGKSGDGGIDGIIKEDKLGLDVIYIQAKKWEGVVSRPEIQKFVGALEGQKAKKGIFITTSTFSKEAKDYAAQISSKVILINGEQLVNFMIENDIGVSKEMIYEMKKIDIDYFTEE
ncbi:MAG: restriction endonuclease [Actinobacteria bacterium]|nr:restriction endonuclease [Actinomycetota bacterium]